MPLTHFANLAPFTWVQRIPYDALKPNGIPWIKPCFSAPVVDVHFRPICATTHRDGKLDLHIAGDNTLEQVLHELHMHTWRNPNSHLVISCSIARCHKNLFLSPWFPPLDTSIGSFGEEVWITEVEDFTSPQWLHTIRHYEKVAHIRNIEAAITDHNTAQYAHREVAFPLHVTIPIASKSTLHRIFKNAQPWKDDPPNADSHNTRLFDYNIFTLDPLGAPDEIPRRPIHSRCNLMYDPPEPTSIHLRHLQTVEINSRIYSIQETHKQHRLCPYKTSAINGFTSRSIHLPMYVTWTQLTTEIIYQLQAQFSSSITFNPSANSTGSMQTTPGSDDDESEPAELHLADPVTVQRLHTWHPASSLQPCLWGTLPTTSIDGAIGDLKEHIWIAVYDTDTRHPPFPEPSLPSRCYIRSLTRQANNLQTAFSLPSPHAFGPAFHKSTSHKPPLFLNLTATDPFPMPLSARFL